MKTALVLEGGAMRGLYTAGVLDKFLEENIKFDAVIGVSAGALFGINYKSKQLGRALRYNLKYAKNKDYIGFSSFIRTGNVMNKEFCFDKLVNIYDPFDFKTYQNNKTLFYATVTNIKNGKAEYPLLTDLTINNDMEFLRASGSMPFLSKPVKVNDNYYLDGALADSIPIKKMEELGYNKIVVVLTRPSGYVKKQKLSHLTKIKYRKYPHLINSINSRYQKYNETIKYIEKEESQNKIVVIRPTKDLHVHRLEKNLNKLEGIYNLGYQDTTINIAKIKKYLTR